MFFPQEELSAKQISQLNKESHFGILCKMLDYLHICYKEKNGIYNKVITKLFRFMMDLSLDVENSGTLFNLYFYETPIDVQQHQQEVLAFNTLKLLEYVRNRALSTVNFYEEIEKKEFIDNYQQLEEELLHLCSIDKETYLRRKNFE